MAVETLVMLTAGVFVVALLYSSVGHAGASGYIAVMTLLSLAPAEIKPIALALNILVASIGSWQFWRAGHFSWALFWPFALLSVPFAFLGGYLNLPTQVFKIIVGVVLLVSAVQFLIRPPAESEPHAPAKPLAMGVGAGLGLLSGLTGTGGGIFLTPLLIFLRWARTKTASRRRRSSSRRIHLRAARQLQRHADLPEFGISLLVAAGIGGAIGSHFGSRRLEPIVIKRLLSVVLVIAGLKLIFT